MIDHRVELVRLARHLPRQGRAYPKSDPHGVDNLLSYFDAQMIDSASRAFKDGEREGIANMVAAIDRLPPSAHFRRWMKSLWRGKASA